MGREGPIQSRTLRQWRTEGTWCLVTSRPVLQRKPRNAPKAGSRVCQPWPRPASGLARWGTFPAPEGPPLGTTVTLSDWTSPPRKGRAQGGGSTQLSDPHTTRPGLSGALGELLVTSLNPRPQEVHIWVEGQSTAGPEETLRPTRAWDQAWWSSGTLSPGAVSGHESRQDALWGRGRLDARLPS